MWIFFSFLLFFTQTKVIHHSRRGRARKLTKTELRPSSAIWIAPIRLLRGHRDCCCAHSLMPELKQVIPGNAYRARKCATRRSNQLQRMWKAVRVDALYISSLKFCFKKLATSVSYSLVQNTLRRGKHMRSGAENSGIVKGGTRNNPEWTQRTPLSTRPRRRGRGGTPTPQACT